MNNDFTFNDNHVFSVDVSHDKLGKIGQASLTFGPKQAISLNFNLGGFEKIEEGKEYDRLTATVQNGQIFTLFNCKLHFDTVYANFVVAGDTIDAFDLVEIELTHVSNWFFQYQHITGDVGTSVEWINRPNTTSADVMSPLGDFSLAITPYTNLIKTKNGNEIRNSAILSIENTHFNLTLCKLRSIINSLCTLFSILLAQPVSIIFARVRGKSGRGLSLYFTHFEKIENTDSLLDGRMEYLLKRDLFDENWKTIAQSFFNSELRDPSWLRLSSMKRYQDFWEYEVAAYVFILNSYVDFKTKTLPKKLSNSANEKIDTFKTRLKASSLTLTQQQDDELIAIATEIFGTKNYTFREMYKFVESQVDENVIKIVNLTEKDFTDLKRFRDDVAHGNPLIINGELSSRIHRLTDKLALLLTYFAFLDFGLTSQDFIACLSNTWNRIVRNSEINQLHLDRVNKSAEFITVSVETLELFKQKIRRKIFSCFDITPGTEPIFSEHHTDLYYKQLFTKKPVGASQDPNDFFKRSDKKVRTVGKLYFENGDDHLQLDHVFLFE
ncbi:hypothetical protein D3C72_151020 [compost metagenome]